VRVHGPLIKWDRNLPKQAFRADRVITGGSSGSFESRRFLTVFTILSRRSVRRHNAVSARAFIAVDTDEVASLLP
jgi:hypothetical protein